MHREQSCQMMQQSFQWHFKGTLLRFRFRAFCPLGAGAIFFHDFSQKILRADAELSKKTLAEI